VPRPKGPDEIQIVPARTAADYAGGRRLFQEYVDWLGVDLGFQQVQEELAQIRKVYSPPRNQLLLARDGSAYAGCVALRDRTRGDCEMKRLYVRPAYRGRGLGRRLARAIIDEARSMGYRRMLLDTLARLTPARRLYRSLGFCETDAYYQNPLPGVIYLALDLEPRTAERP
jgi:ribosomal protein S18 acetylase RimI-like enzyme